jgi:hypothetical protein
MLVLCLTRRDDKQALIEPDYVLRRKLLNQTSYGYWVLQGADSRSTGGRKPNKSDMGEAIIPGLVSVGLITSTYTFTPCYLTLLEVT